jgi:hypothetical protein
MPKIYSDYELSLLSNEQLEKYKCGICNNIIHRPTSVCSSFHIFCENCVKTIHENYRSCPDVKCSYKYDPKRTEHIYHYDREFDDEIKMLQIRCDGKCCNWIGTLKDYYNHHRNCEYTIQQCHKCDKHFPTLIYKNHCDNCNPPEPFKCIYCGVSVQIKDAIVHEKCTTHIKNKINYYNDIYIESMTSKIENLEKQLKNK